MEQSLDEHFMAEQPCLAGSAIRAQTAEDVCSDEALRSGHNHTDSLCVSSIGLLCTSLPPPSLFLCLLLLMAAQINRAGPQAHVPAPNQLFQELCGRSPGGFLPN